LKSTRNHTVKHALHLFHFTQSIFHGKRELSNSYQRNQTKLENFTER
jgi:hypothetical protein